MSDYLMEFKTNKAYMEMNIQEGATIPNCLVYVKLQDKGLTKESFIDVTLGDPSKKYSECFYIATINDVDYCAVGRCAISVLNGCPTGNYESLSDEVFAKWAGFFASESFYAPEDLPTENI